MDGDKVYTGADIPAWEKRLKAEVRKHPPGPGGRVAGSVRRAELVLHMLKAGVEVRNEHEGLVLNGRVVLAISASKWRKLNRWKWYPYASLDQVVTVAQGGRLSRDPDADPAQANLRNRFLSLRSAMGPVDYPTELPSDPDEARQLVERMASDYERMRDDGKLPATVKQVSYAAAISRRLGIPLPDSATRTTLGDFISVNEARFKEMAKGRIEAKPQEVEAAIAASEVRRTSAGGGGIVLPLSKPAAKPAPRKVAAPEPTAANGYAGLRRAIVATDDLAELGMESVDDLVRWLNEARAHEGQPPINAEEFPTSRAKFRRLAEEFLSM